MPSDIRNIAKKINFLKKRIIVVKIPASLVNQQENMQDFIADLLVLFECGIKIYIIHDFADVEKHSGFLDCSSLITTTKDPATLYEMLLFCHVNKHLVGILNNSGIPSVGLSGKENKFLVSKHIRKLQLTGSSQNYSLPVTEPFYVAPEILMELENTSIVPIIAPIATSENGHTVFVETNLASAMIAVALGADYLVFIGNWSGPTDAIRVDKKENIKQINEHFHDIEDTTLKASKYALDSSQIMIHVIKLGTNGAFLKSFID